MTAQAKEVLKAAHAPETATLLFVAMRAVNECTHRPGRELFGSKDGMMQDGWNQPGSGSLSPQNPLTPGTSLW